MKKNFTLPESMPNSLLISIGKSMSSRTGNRFYRQTVASDKLSLITAKHEMCTAEATLISNDRRFSGVLEASSTSPKNIESTASGSIKVISPCKGLGIVDFIKDKNFLITGATGFVAKALIEKI